MPEDLRVGRSLTIPGDELDLTFSTSGGPGGQHANRSSTRVTIGWNVDTSKALGERQRKRIQTRLRRRIDNSATLRVASDRYRSQLRNREDAMDRLAELIADALRPRKNRVATAPTKASRERRLQQKRRRSEVKKARRLRDDD